MKKSPIFAGLYAIGVTIILLGFILLVPAGARNEVAILDLAIVVCVFTLSFPLASPWWTQGGSFDSRIPALSVFWFVDGIYAFLALGGLVFMAVQLVPFRIQLLYQIVLLFGVAFAFGVAWWASELARRVASQESAQKAGLTELRGVLSQLDDAFGLAGSGWHHERERIWKLREDVRFLAPTSRDRELGVEANLLKELNGIRILLGAAEPQSQRADLVSRIDKCDALMSMRKQANIRQGDPS
jgi:hypothetical protein